MKDAAVLDTNVLIHDPEAICHLQEDGFNVFIPWVVILELDAQKNKPDIGMDAREALRNIEKSQRQESITIFKTPNFKNLKGLSKDIADHQIIATAKSVMENKNSHYKEIVLFSKDRSVRILSSTLEIKARDYTRERVEESEGSELKTVNVSKEDILFDKEGVPLVPVNASKAGGDVLENEGVLAYCDWDPFTKERGDWDEKFAMLKKGGYFKIIDNRINAVDLKPFSMNSNNGYNWHQHIALAQLLDLDIRLVFLQGGAGSGKTLLSLASAIEMRKHFIRIAITRPMIAVEDEEKMFTLPGDMKEKAHPWLLPIRQALNFIKGEVAGGKHKPVVSQMEESEKIYTAPLDYFRGTTFHREFILIDDSQNLTPHQVKTIITRAGPKAKMVFTGDLGQIDRRRKLDKHTSGLAYAAAKMADHKLTALTVFKETVRSELVQLAEERKL